MRLFFAPSGLTAAADVRDGRVMRESKPLVLVADDEPPMNDLVVLHLRSMPRQKVDIVQAHDGGEAWRLAKEHLPDLVVLDVMMPEMSGWEVCRKIREDVALAHTGVVMLTGIGETLNSLTSPLYGADAYLDKPFSPEALHRAVKQVLDKRAAQRNAAPRPSTHGLLQEVLAEDNPRGARNNGLATVRKKAEATKNAKKKATMNKSTTKSTKKTAAKKAAPAKAPAKKSAVKAPARKSAVKAPAKKAAPAKAPAKKSVPAKAPAKKSVPAKAAKAPAKKR